MKTKSLIICKQYLFILLILFFQISAGGQEVSYSAVDAPSFAKTMKNGSMQLAYNRNMQFLFDSFAGIYLDEKKAKKESEQAALRIAMLQKNFSSREKYPDSIASGWHAVVLTGDNDFYKDVKVFVSGNTVRQLVIEDCIRIPCTAKEKIKDAKTAIALKNINAQFEILNIYFSNDLDKTALVAEPVQPGYVCFWTSKSRYLNERLLISGIRRDFIKELHEEEPACFAPGVPFYILKPGKYSFRATATGNDKEAWFEIKSGMCLTYRIK